LKIALILIGIICSLLSSGISEALATLEDDLKGAPSMLRQNNRTIKRVGDFAEQCTDRVSSDPSVTPICDSLLQKFNIDMGKFLVENQNIIEELIYPYTLPSSIHTSTDLSSATVTGTNDRLAAAEHGSISIKYLETVSDISKECSSRAMSNDVAGIKPCMTVMNSLNSHMKEFNQNARSEFDTILGTVTP